MVKIKGQQLDIANVVDDHHMGITHVFRGVEWLVSTPKHIALYNAFGWIPPAFAHLPLMLNSDGTKLSKRNQDESKQPVHVEKFRDMGYYSDALVNFITLTGGGFRDRNFGEDKLFTLSELSARFDYKLFKTHSSKIEFERLEKLNHLSLIEKLQEANSDLSNENISSNTNITNILFDARSQIGGTDNPKHANISDDILLKRLQWLVKEGRIHKLSDLSQAKDLQFLWFEPPLCTSYGSGISAMVFEDVIVALKTCDSYSSPSELSSAVRSVAKVHKKNGVKVSTLMAAIRLALSGLPEGPPVGEMIDNLGLESAIDRIKRAVSAIENDKLEPK